MKKVNIAFGIHNHQPVGNFDFVFEEAYNKSYLPFLELMERHPGVKMAQHYTGILFEWIKEHKPDFIPRLRILVERGQVEMMTGGYYEPVMSVIPYADKVGQVKKLTDFVVGNTGYAPRGMWLAERIWEPHLPKAFAEAGVEYVVLDDSHFKNAGLQGGELHGYYVTEEEGHSVFLFPVSEQLRYTIPFQMPEKTIEFLDSIATEDGQALVVFADDGEKFGVWPETYKHCYEDRWLERFFSALEENSSWINIIHLSQALDEIEPKGRVYLPTASYREMMEWAMPAQAITDYDAFEDVLKQQDLHEKYKVFVRGGFWRNFMVKYPESNNMHKKMLHLSRRLQRLQGDFGSDSVFLRARDHIWAGQCNCPYWHGVFGGLYLNHLRYATYHQFLQAEAILDQLENPGSGDDWVKLAEEDFDGDGFPELLVSNRLLNLYISPKVGGAIFELDYKPRALNLLDTMARRKESYHQKLVEHAASQSDQTGQGNADEHGEIASIHDIVVVKEEGLEKQLFYDWHRRSSLQEHFLAHDTTLESFAQCSYRELGDFVTGQFEQTVVRSDNQIDIRLERRGALHDDGTASPVHLVKRLTLSGRSSTLRVAYEIRNLSNSEQDYWFASEWGFALLAGDAHDRYYVFPGTELEDARLRSTGEVAGREAGVVDEWLKVAANLKMDQDTSFWRFPIETVSQSESGFERVYQSSVLLPNWKFRLAAGEKWEVAFELEIK